MSKTTEETTNETTHTPGPWLNRRAHFDSAGNYTPYVSAGDTSKVLFFMNLSGAYGGYAGLAQAEADARLIAAAPDMLKVLKTILPMLDECGYGGSNQQAEKKHIAMIQNAIKKAEGRT